ncbi:hypothetical protein SRABI76_02365 [Microbacterium oxydans]|uniref:hypothetical protein n=1 Tax=Microbacterium oxydans TaxID=82380 RepID=UPI001DB762B0|nr:hypothetical protein [Microbacterium oxydans]CAH0215069.1 hypothetical protein SRABI76_02365 [Microbacterium oxydans]
MDRTPTAGKCYEIIAITGDAAAIERRGIEIESLGDQMLGAADLLDTIDLGAECRGKSLDALQGDVTDVKDDLRKAGERYQPSGTHIVEYARSLDDVQTTLSTLIPDLEDLWNAYQTTAGQFEDDSQLPEPEAGESADDRTSAADVEGDLDAWKARAIEYETTYDSWWEAYERARTGIQAANDDGVHDSWWDDQLPWLETLGTILSYAGIVLAVAACILGGPFILIAAIVGLAALAVTVWKVSCGRGNGWDIAMAAVGVFPFGKAFALAKGLRAAPTLSTLGRGLLGMGGDVVGAGWRSGSRLTGVLADGTTGQVFHAAGAVNRHGTAVMRNFFNGLESPSMLSRLLRGGDGAWSASIGDAAGALSNRATSNLNSFLANTPNGSVMSDMLSGGSSAALDFLDNLGKAGTGFAYDRSQSGWS